MPLREYQVYPIKGGTISGTNQSTSTSLPTSESTRTYGGASSLLGLTWTPSDINSSSFGIAVSVQASNAPAQISNYLKCTNFGFSIPATHSIVGIQFIVKWVCTGNNTVSAIAKINYVTCTVYTTSAGNASCYSSMILGGV